MLGIIATCHWFYQLNTLDTILCTAIVAQHDCILCLHRFIDVYKQERTHHAHESNRNRLCKGEERKERVVVRIRPGEIWIAHHRDQRSKRHPDRDPQWPWVCDEICLKSGRHHEHRTCDCGSDQLCTQNPCNDIKVYMIDDGQIRLQQDGWPKASAWCRLWCKNATEWVHSMDGTWSLRPVLKMSPPHQHHATNYMQYRTIV